MSAPEAEVDRSARDGVERELLAWMSEAKPSADAERFERLALALFHRLESEYGLTPDTVACSTAIAAYSRMGDYPSALTLFRRMRRMPCARRDVVAEGRRGRG